jgi:hypothetical protein
MAVTDRVDARNLQTVQRIETLAAAMGRRAQRPNPAASAAAHTYEPGIRSGETGEGGAPVGLARVCAPASTLSVRSVSMD